MVPAFVPRRLSATADIAYMGILGSVRSVLRNESSRLHVDGVDVQAGLLDFAEPNQIIQASLIADEPLTLAELTASILIGWRVGNLSWQDYQPVATNRLGGKGGSYGTKNRSITYYPVASTIYTDLASLILVPGQPLPVTLPCPLPILPLRKPSTLLGLNLRKALIEDPTDDRQVSAGILMPGYRMDARYLVQIVATTTTGEHASGYALPPTRNGLDVFR